MSAADVPALVISAAALFLSIVATLRQLRTARQANSLPVLVDLFREHRSQRLSNAREFVFNNLGDYDTTLGLAGLPDDKRDLVRDLSWYYDNLGALVAHDVVDLEPVAGYLGGSVVAMYERLAPLIEAERDRRGNFQDPTRWQAYFQNLYLLVQESHPAALRRAQRLWRL